MTTYWDSASDISINIAVMSHLSILLDQLFKLRLAIGRLGELDNMGWWNTQGVLGVDGGFVYQRSFPMTHYFAQARVVFAVARSRCQETFIRPNSANLWHLPAEIEDQFENRWQYWLNDLEGWQPYLEKITAIQSRDVAAVLRNLDLVSEMEIADVKQLEPSIDRNSLVLPHQSTITVEAIRKLAGAFLHADPGRLLVPYMPLA